MKTKDKVLAYSCVITNKNINLSSKEKSINSVNEQKMLRKTCLGKISLNYQKFDGIFSGSGYSDGYGLKGLKS